MFKLKRKTTDLLWLVRYKQELKLKTTKNLLIIFFLNILSINTS